MERSREMLRFLEIVDQGATRDGLERKRTRKRVRERRSKRRGRDEGGAASEEGHFASLGVCLPGLTEQIRYGKPYGERNALNLF